METILEGQEIHCPGIGLFPEALDDKKLDQEKNRIPESGASWSVVFSFNSLCNRVQIR